MPARRSRARRRTVDVLRIGHRPGRDPRISTHLALVARAFGARRLFLEPADPGLAERLDAVGRRFGGRFRVVGVDRWREVVKSHSGTVVHLTMYGEPIERSLAQLRRDGALLVVVGGAKVPGEMFGLADRNVAIGSQPHSEVGALAVFLDRLNDGPPPSVFRGGTHRVVPQVRGKRVVARRKSTR